MNKQKLKDKIHELYRECNYVNWDSYEGDPVKQEAMESALVFLEALPLDIEEPFISPMGTGWLEFEWGTALSTRVVLVDPQPDVYTYYCEVDGVIRIERSGTPLEATATVIAFLQQYFPIKQEVQDHGQEAK